MNKRLEHIKEALLCVVEAQLCDLTEVNAEELGEVIDMIKDIDEAIYYHTVTEAMKGREEEWETEMKKSDHHQERKDDGRWYYDSSHPVAEYSGSEKTHWVNEGSKPMKQGENTSWLNNNMSSRNDEREGRSHISRKMYMEAKDTKKDKATQLRELEKYMAELSQDVVDMINDATTEEKQYLEKKIAALATKVGQMK